METRWSRLLEFLNSDFIKPGNSDNRYLGIWYKNISVRTVVWVANRDHPLLGTSPLVLKITSQGILSLFNNISMIWSSNTTTTGNTTARLQDNGNLVVIDQQGKVIWQSFDYPTDTLLPGMKLGRDYRRGITWRLTPWKSSQDPAPGYLTWGTDTLGYPEAKLKRGASIIYRSGPWNNERFIGVFVFSKNLNYTFDIIVNQSEVSFAYNLEDDSVQSRAILNSSMHLEQWVEEGRGWQQFGQIPRSPCDTYNICNAYGTCNINLLQLSCTRTCMESL